MRSTLAAAAVVFLSSLLHPLPSAADTVTSPNGRIVATVTVSGGDLVYSVTFDGATVVETSRLGMTMNGFDLGSGARLVMGGGVNGTSTWNFDSRHGVHAAVANYTARTRAVNVTHVATGRTFVVNVAVWNNGLAFRYEVGGPDAKGVTGEASSFVLPDTSTLFYQTNTSVYEGSFTSGAIGAIADNTSMGPPVTVRLPGPAGYLAITQSALTSGVVFPSPYLVKRAGRRLQVAYPTNADGSPGVGVIGPVKTSWNVIMVASDLDMLVNNDIVESLTPPPGALFPEGALTPWCRPGRSVWNWLNPQPGGRTPANAMVDNDYASRLGYEYNTVDEGWAGWNGGNPWPDVQSVVADATARNVRVLLWKRSSELATGAQRAAFFQLLRDHGVAGFKADFFDFGGVSAGARERVALMRDMLQQAAEFQLVVNFHGASKPFGLFKTYPNLLQVEGVFGKESFAGGFNMVTLPFTRFLAGPADFTPLALQGPLRGARTPAFEIATVVHFAGPLVTMAERSDNIFNSPFREVIQAIPTLWDETRVLAESSLGVTCAMARRKGADWFLAITNRVASRSWTIPLSFLSGGVTYRAQIVRDASTGIEESTADAGGTLAVTAANEGGIVVRFTPQF
jgi:hypothetical protein